jgi:hypothetical protein
MGLFRKAEPEHPLVIWYVTHTSCNDPGGPLYPDTFHTEQEALAHKKLLEEQGHWNIKITKADTRVH